LGGLTDGVTVLDMCAAYCTFPNGGKYIKPATYTKVVDSNGKVLLEHSPGGQIAISETTARDMVSMMTDVVTGGTGTAARLSNMPAAGKTGTTSSNNDRWFVGFTPYYVGAVWFGYDEPTSLKGFSPNPAAVAWRKVMTEVHKGLKSKQFFSHLNSGERTVMICAESGLRATPACNKLTSKKFKTKSVPEKTCTQHKYKFNKNELNKGAENENVIKKNTVVKGTVDDLFSTEESVSQPSVPENETSNSSQQETGSNNSSSNESVQGEENIAQIIG